MRPCITLALVLSALALDGCSVRTPIYRANVKLLITKSGVGTPTGNSTRDDDERFIAAQADILRNVTILQRTQQRMKKTVEEIRDNLTGLNVAPVRGGEIIIISVESPSPDFAKDFANALADEYLKFRNEQRAQTSESALSPLIQETHRLSQELKAINEKLATFDKEHNVSANPELSELQALFENRERVQGLYDASLARLMKADAAQDFNARQVIVLEPAILEPNRV